MLLDAKTRKMATQASEYFTPEEGSRNRSNNRHRWGAVQGFLSWKRASRTAADGVCI